MRKFIEANGYGILHYVLSKHFHFWNVDTFEVLFELTLDGVFLRSGKKPIRNREPFFLVLDLIPLCPPSLRKHVVQAVTDLVTLRENLSLLSSKEECGVTVFTAIFHLFTNLNEIHPLLAILRKVASTLSAEEIEILFDFLVCDPESHLEMKFEIFQLLYDEMQNSPHILDYLVKAGGFNVAFALLDSPSENLRVLTVKLLGFFNSNPKHLASFQRISGFETMAELISKHPLTNQIADTLLQFSLGAYQGAGEKKSGWMNIFSSTSDQSKQKKEGVKKVPSLFVHPEGLHVLFDTLRATRDVDLQRQVIHNIEKFLNPENMEILWSTNWLEWLLEFLQTFEPNTQSPVVSQVHHSIQKMMIHDITKKTSQVSKLKELVENETFQTDIIQDVVDYYEKKSSHPLPAEHASDIVFNLVQLFKFVDEIECPPKRTTYFKIFFIYFIFLFSF